ncbi:MAG: siphovirus Gp157 family protein [Gammaproteobacteria bacterium]|nr:siphovirus Gp157 family protein [Gammaproteobacteria bacterium]
MHSTLRLYQIADNYLLALDALADRDDLPAEVINDTMEGLQGAFEDKALNVARYIRNLEAEASAINEAKKRMEARARVTGNQAKRLKSYLRDELKRTGIKIKAPDLALRIQNNPPSVVIDRVDQIPDTFKETETITRVLKAEVGRALKAGEVVAGAHLERTTRLVIT